MSFYRIFLFLLFPVLLFLTSCEDDDQSAIQPDLLTGQELTKSQVIDGDFELTLNPHDIAPLAASLSFTSKGSYTTEITVLGDVPYTRSFYQDSIKNSHPVLGLYPGMTNKIAITLVDEDENFYRDTLELKTNPLSELLPEVEVLVSDQPAMAEGWTLSGVAIGEGSSYRSMPIIFDHTGAIRWYFDLDDKGGLVYPVEQAKNGNLLIARNAQIFEYGFLGEKLKTYDIPGYHHHHETIEKPNGNFIVAVSKDALSTVEDYIIEIDRNTGAIVNEWDMREILDYDRTTLIDGGNDWFHMNGIAYSEPDDCLIISGRNQGVVKVTAENELVWILAPHEGWGKAGINGDGFETSEFLLTAIDNSGMPYADSVQLGYHNAPDFDWVWGQHAPLILPNGNLFLFDNGFNRFFVPADENSYSRGVEYKIDEANATVKQVWQYGKGRTSDLFSPIISDVDYHEDTDTRIISSGICGLTTNGPFLNRIVEVNSSSKGVVFEATVSFKNLLSPGTFDWGGFDIAYRAERIDMSEVR